ncbi:hypothetical protein ONZ45_g3384 [Pleurotus djamor]|nr:hypothetical protein ONZ45_g3384 [Pleurotus djamor]
MPDSELFQIKPSVAAIEIGVIVSSFLFGILTLQAYTYFSRAFEDGRLLKWLVSVIWFLELGHAICVTHLIYTATILAEPSRLREMIVNTPVDINTGILLSGSTSCIVQAYFAHRIRRLTGLLWLSISLWCLILLTMIGTIGVCVVSYTGGLEDFTKNWGWVSLTSWIASAIIDFVNAVVLAWCLVRHRQSALRTTHRLIDKIMLITISTGSLTCIFDVVTAICFLKMPYTLYLGLYICIARVYAISLFASCVSNLLPTLLDIINRALLHSLNARTGLRKEEFKNPSNLFTTIQFNSTEPFTPSSG